MMNLAEYRNRNTRLADYLPWVALVGEGVVLNKDGSFQRTARFRGPDLDSAVPAELVAVAGRLNNAFRRLGSGWAIFVEAQRHGAATYPASMFADSASALVDAERKADFEEAGAHFESSYFVTFLYLPPAEDAARAETWLYEGRDHAGVDAHEILRGFIDRTDRVLNLIDAFMPQCAWLDDGETLTYLHSTVSTKRHRVRVPETPMYLDALLADQPLIGGLEPRLGDAQVRILTIVGFPTATTPGILDELNRLAFPYRWSTRAVLLDKTDATKLLTKIRRQWFAKRKSIAAILKEVMTNEASALVDTDAANKAADADMALQELGADYAGQAYVTATITVWDDDPRIAAEKLRLVEKVIQGRDFTAMAETINAVDAWLGSLPGHVYANVRQPPISTLNLAHMIPLSAVWAGPERDEHFGAPPLLYGRTEGSTPFRLSIHVGDVGHTLIVGPTGAGKSVLLALMALQFRRYPQSQVFAFDFGGSIRAAALAMRGDWRVAPATGPHRRRRRARLGLRLADRDPLPRERAGHARGQGTPLVGAIVTGVGANRGAHADRPIRPAPVQRPEAGAATLLCRRPVWPALRRRVRTSRRGACPGLRDRRADRHRRSCRRARLSLSSHRGPLGRPADTPDRR